MSTPSITVMQSSVTNPVKLIVSEFHDDTDLFKYVYLCKFDIINEIDSVQFHVFFRKSVDY